MPKLKNSSELMLANSVLSDVRKNYCDIPRKTTPSVKD